MALSKNIGYAVQGATRQLHVKIAVAGTYYKGGILSLDPSTGYAVKAADATGLGKTAGVLTEGVTVASGEVKDAVIEIGSIWINNASAAQTDVGDPVYATADDTLASSATNATAIGIVEDVIVGKQSLVCFGRN